MSETTNYHLFLTDSDSMRFIDWREQINGKTNSNMVKIDAALSEKAHSSVAISATLTASGWTGSAAPFTQTINVAGLTANQNGTISVAQSATAAQRESAREAILSPTGQTAGKLTISADGDKPTVNIPVVVILMG